VCDRAMNRLVAERYVINRVPFQEALRQSREVDLMKFEDSNWRDPLHDLANLVYKKWPGDRVAAFNTKYRSYRRTLRYIRLICRRIEDDIRLWSSYNNASERLLGAPGARLPTKSDLLIQERWKEHQFCLYLDLDDFFIHSNILMDKSASIAAAFLKIDPPRSFSKHKKSLCKRENIPFRKDEDYARHVREDTNWFESDLKGIRDDLVVHEGAFWAIGTSWNRKGLLSVSKMSPFEIKRRHLSVLQGLREKYQERLNGIGGLDNNLWVLLEFFEHDIDQIDEEDKTKVKAARRELGGRLPAVSKVADEIFDFLTFFGLHFQEKLRGKNRH